MTFARLKRLPTFAAALLALACGGDDGGGTGPCTPGPATQTVQSGNSQNWYFSNPLPASYTLTALDVSNCPVPGVVVNWVPEPGAGSVNPTQSTTNASGVASTLHTLGPAGNTQQRVTATATNAPALQAVTFTAFATAPPTSAVVEVDDNIFRPASFVIQKDSVVTWSWVGGLEHNVTFTSGPTPRPAIITDRTTGSVERRIALVGTYNYTCTNHGGMNGSVTVVN